MGDHPVLVVVLGIGMLAGGVMMYQNQQSDVRNAVKSEATVQSTGSKQIGGETPRNPTAEYEPVVKYTYTYEGEEYTSKSVYPGPEKRFNFKENAREVSGQYSPGQNVTVYINQENPSRAYLIKETGGNKLPYFLLGFGAIFLLTAIGSFGKKLLGLG